MPESSMFHRGRGQTAFWLACMLSMAAIFPPSRMARAQVDRADGGSVAKVETRSLTDFSKAGGASSDALSENSVRPLFRQYCLKCHSSEKHKGDIDLERFSSLNEVKRHPNVWQDVAEPLANH